MNDGRDRPAQGQSGRNAIERSFRSRETDSDWFKMEAYNLSNSFTASDPSTDVFSSLFVGSTAQANIGRQMLDILRLHF
jgi:hypothetical protein